MTRKQFAIVVGLIAVSYWISIVPWSIVQYAWGAALFILYMVANISTIWAWMRTGGPTSTGPSP